MVRRSPARRRRYVIGAVLVAGVGGIGLGAAGFQSGDHDPGTIHGTIAADVVAPDAAGLARLHKLGYDQSDLFVTQPGYRIAFVHLDLAADRPPADGCTWTVFLSHAGNWNPAVAAASPQGRVMRAGEVAPEAVAVADGLDPQTVSAITTDNDGSHFALVASAQHAQLDIAFEVVPEDQAFADSPVGNSRAYLKGFHLDAYPAVHCGSGDTIGGALSHGH